MNLTGWPESLEVTADGEGIVSHAGLALLRQLAGKAGLTGGLSRALASPRLLIHDRGRVTAGLACAIADGSEVISGFRVLADQKELFGLGSGRYRPSLSSLASSPSSRATPYCSTWARVVLSMPGAPLFARTITHARWSTSLR